VPGGVCSAWHPSGFRRAIDARKGDKLRGQSQSTRWGGSATLYHAHVLWRSRYAPPICQADDSGPWVLLHAIERQPAAGRHRQCHPRKPRRLNCAAVTNSWRPAQMRATRWRRSIELTTGCRNSDEEMSYDTRRRSLIPAHDPIL
jgi:hypothetical protein